MKIRMYIASAVTLVLMFVFIGIYSGNKTDIFLTLAIISCAVCYHLTARLVVGSLVDFKLRNVVDYKRKWFLEKPFEKKLYKKLRVRKWKDSLPTAEEELFSLKKHTLLQIIMASCQAEIVHEICIIISFLAIFLAIPFGQLLVFILTSVIGALYDLLFVIIQRYNRPRFIKSMRWEEKNNKE